jgi:hypothetical protein
MIKTSDAHNQLLSRFLRQNESDYSCLAAYDAQFRSRMLFHHRVPIARGADLPLLPFMFSKSAARRMNEDLVTVLGTIGKITERIFDGNRERHAHFLRLSPRQSEFATQARLSPSAPRMARPDCILDASGIKIIESNIGSGVGLIPDTHIYTKYYGDNRIINECCNRLFQTQPQYRDPLDALKVILARFPEPIWFVRSRPRDPDFCRMRMHVFLSDYLRAAGLNLLIENYPDEDDHEVLSDGDIGSIFLAISTYQLEDRFDEFIHRRDLLYGRTGCPVISAPCTLLVEHKANLAILSDGRYHHYFDEREREAITRTIPWTRRVSVELVERLTRQKNEYVLKRGADYGGRSVFIGCRISQTEFDSILRRALQDGDWIAQQFVQSIEHENAVVLDHKVVHRQFQFILRVFIFDTDVVGYFCSTTETEAVPELPGLVSGSRGVGIVAISPDA